MNKESKHKLSSNYIFNLLYQTITIVYPLIVTPYLSRVFGPDGVGKYSFSVSIVTYFSILFLCIGKYGFREISFISEDQKEKQSSIFWEIFLLKAILLGISTIPYICISFCSANYKTLLLVQWFSLLNGLFDIGWFFQGKQNFKIPALVGIANKVLLLALIFLLIRSSTDVNRYAFLICFVTLIGSLSMWPFLAKKIEKPTKLCLKNHLVPCLLFSIPYILLEVYSSIDKTMIGLITGSDSENGFYEQTIKIIRLLMTVATCMSVIKAPIHSVLYEKNDKDGLEKSLSNSFSYLFFVSIPLMLGVCLIASDFIPLFLGDGFDKVVTLIYWYSPFVLFYGMVDLFVTQFFVAAKKQNIYTYSVLTSLVANVILNFLLIPRYQSLGAIISTVLSEFIAFIILAIPFFKTFSIKNITHGLWKYFFAGALMFCVVFFASRNWQIKNNAFSIFLQIIIGAATYFFILLITRDDFFYNFVISHFRKRKDIKK